MSPRPLIAVRLQTISALLCLGYIAYRLAHTPALGTAPSLQGGGLRKGQVSRPPAGAMSMSCNNSVCSGCTQCGPKLHRETSEYYTGYISCYGCDHDPALVSDDSGVWSQEPSGAWTLACAVLRAVADRKSHAALANLPDFVVSGCNDMLNSFVSEPVSSNATHEVYRWSEAGYRGGATFVEAFERVERVRASSLTAAEFQTRFFDVGRPVILEGGMESIASFSGGPLERFSVAHMFDIWPREFQQPGAAGGVRMHMDMLEGKWSLVDVLRNLNARSMVPIFFFKNSVATQQVRRHLDTNCGTFVSHQYEGQKRWLLWPLSEDMPTGTDSQDMEPPREFAARGVYAALGVRPTIAVIEPGDILVFYPGWWHQTNVIEAPSLSMSVFLQDLVSQNYLAKLWPTLATMPRYALCTSLWRKVKDGTI